MQNLKSLPLSGCEGKQKHQMAAEKTRDNDSGWEAWSHIQHHVGSAGLCQGSCSCLRAHSAEEGMEMGSPELDPAGSGPRAHRGSTTQGQQILALHSAVPSPWLARPTEASQEPFAGTSLILGAQKWQGTKPRPAQSGCSVGKGLEQLGRVGSDLPGAGSTRWPWHRGGSRAERVHSIWLPLHGMGQQIPYF